MLIAESLSQQAIELSPAVVGAAEVIRLLSERLAPRFSLSVRQIEQAVLSREKARTTALNNRAAIPHCRLPGLDRFACGLMLLKTPITWDHQGHQVDTVLMVVGPAEAASDHLRILANSSQLLDSPAIRACLSRAPDAAAVYSVISAAEEAIERRRQEQGMLREIREKQSGPGSDYLEEVAHRFAW